MDAEDRPSRLTLDLGVAAVGVDHRSNDREPQPGASGKARARTVPAHETFED